MSKKVKTLKVLNSEINLFKQRKDDYISLTDIARHRDADRSDYILQNWLRNRSTIEFIGLWEQLNNPDFNSIEFDGFKNEAGSRDFMHKDTDLDGDAQRISQTLWMPVNFKD